MGFSAVGFSAVGFSAMGERYVRSALSECCNLRLSTLRDYP